MYRIFDHGLRIGFAVFFMALIAGLYFLITENAMYGQMVSIGSVAGICIMTCSFVELLTASYMSRTEKCLWLLALFITTVIGAMAYYLLGRRPA